jgi:uncharacterized protein with HEPN domain
MSDKRNHYRMFLKDIRYAAVKILRYTGNVNFAAFARDEELVDAVIHNFRRIGETVAYLPAAITQKYPEVEWKKALAFHRVLVGRYFGVDMDTLWETIQLDVPLFLRRVERVLAAEGIPVESGENPAAPEEEIIH